MAKEILRDVLLVTADVATTRLCLAVLAAKGIRGTVARDAAAAAGRIEQRTWDAVFIDLGTTEADGLALVRLIKQRYPELPVVLAGDQASVPTAVRAMREGCHDYLVKPLERTAVEALCEALLPRHAAPLAAAEEADSRCLFQIAGRSPRLFETIALAKKVAPTTLPVLITGESGTGKELIAYLVHRSSRRSHGPYVRVNCAALSESLLESELFGHERGAFTGACSQRQGRFERANGGTLLLDEISETGPRLQAELLRVLEQQDFERVGGTEPVSVNVRIISTTNRDLAADVQRGAFRADLYYRLCGVRIPVPPLRQRREDIPVLVWHFVNQFACEVGRQITRIDPEMIDLFLRCSWPGNVRLLRNVVRTALVVGDGPVLSLAQTPWIRAELLAACGGPALAAPAFRPSPLAEEGGRAPAGEERGEMMSARARTLRLRDVERQTIFEALRLTGDHQARAAQLLGITDRTLREKMRRYREEHPTVRPQPLLARTAGVAAAPSWDADLEPSMAGESHA